jgi:hypothetical protein
MQDGSSNLVDNERLSSSCRAEGTETLRAINALEPTLLCGTRES